MTWADGMKRFLQIVWFIFWFVFFVGGTLAICWDHAHQNQEIDKIIREHKQGVKQ